MAAINNKKCPFCKDKIKNVDYKNLKVLNSYVTSFGKILPRYYSGVCLVHQKRLAMSIKRARMMSLIPFVK